MAKFSIEDITIKRIFQDMFKYSPSKLFGLFGNAITIPIYTNLLSQEQYGLFILSTATLSFLCILFSDWVGLSGLRFYAQFKLKNKVSDYLSTIVILLLCNLATMFVFALTFREQFFTYFKIPSNVFYAILILIIPVAIRALLFQILRAQIKPIAFTISTIINQITTILFAVLIIQHFNLGGVSILVGMGISIVMIDILMIIQSKIYKEFKFKQINFKHLKPIFHYGLPIAVTSLSSWLITQGNKFILQFLDGSSQVGLVGVAYNLTFSILLTLFSILTIATFPRLINLYEEKSSVTPVVSRMTHYFLTISLPIVVAISLYSHDMVLLMANKRFESAHILIPFLAAAAFLLSLTEYTTFQYYLKKKTYYNTAIKIFSGITGLVLAYFAIKEYGLIGVGISTLLANLLYFALSVTIVLPKMNINFSIAKLSMLAMSFIPSLALYQYVFKSFDSHVLIRFFSFITCYYLVYYGLQKGAKKLNIIQ